MASTDHGFSGYPRTAMFSRIKRLFSKNRETERDPDDTITELWTADFRKPAQARFVPETGDAYASALTPAGLRLNLQKRQIFAWTVNPLYRYRNFIAEATVAFENDAEGAKGAGPGETPSNNGRSGGERAGSCAAGLLFRYLNESTFYSLLISDRGLLRLDAVVNGTPLPVLGWTETGGSPHAVAPAARKLRLIARDTSFTLIVDDAWVAECHDDTIQAAGRIAFAGQNWGMREAASPLLSALTLDTRPFEIETVHTRWARLIPIPAEARVNLAKTLYSMGKYVPAILELKRARKAGAPDAEQHLLAAQAYLAQQLFPEAEEESRAALALEGGNLSAAAELGGILYLQNRFPELETLLGSLERSGIERSPFLSNLEGHLRHWRGESEAAAQAYERAAALTPDQGIFRRNAGAEWKDCGQTDRAVEAWLGAGNAFLGDNAYDDLGELLASLRELAPKDPRVLALEGKFEYGRGNHDQAAKALDKAIKAGSGDSGVWYLHGMLLSERGKTAKAIEAFRKAVEREPEYGPYRFRLAETLFFAGLPCDEEMDGAFETGAENGWVHNLAALRALSRDDLGSASAHAAEALRLLPEERDVIVNYAEVERRFGRLDAALSLFDQNDAAFLRAGANLLVEDRRHEEADEWYRRAQKRTPYDPELLADRAANCIELNYLNEADDLLGRALDYASSPRLYKLISYLASRKGEFTRCEVALQQGLSEFPEDPDLLYELSAVYLATNRPAKAEEVRARLEAVDSGERIRALEEEILEKSTVSFGCSACGRRWRVPKDLPPQGSLHLTAQPPDDLPAGTCPQCKTVLCIGCGKETLGEDGRFRCRSCGVPLKLIDNNIIWILNQWQANAPAEGE